MKKKLKKTGGLYAYLHAQGVLDKSDEEIKQAKRAYYALYKREWKRNKLKANKSFLVILSKDEYAFFKADAAKHKRSITTYIREAALSYSTDRYLTPDLVQLYEIKDLLNRNVIAFQKAIDESQVSFSESREVLKRIERLEHDVLTRIQYPMTVDTWLEERLQEDSKLREKILIVLQTSLSGNKEHF